MGSALNVLISAMELDEEEDEDDEEAVFRSLLRVEEEEEAVRVLFISNKVTGQA